MLDEQLLHLNQHIEGTHQVGVFGMESLCDSRNASHDDSHVLALLDGEVRSYVIWHGFCFQKLEEHYQWSSEFFGVEQFAD